MEETQRDLQKILKLKHHARLAYLLIGLIVVAGLAVGVPEIVFRYYLITGLVLMLLHNPLLIVAGSVTMARARVTRVRHQ
jgi:hypothetical protein